MIARSQLRDYCVKTLDLQPIARASALLSGRFRAPLHVLLACALTAFAMPVLAQQAPVAEPAAGAQETVAPAESSRRMQMPESLSDRALFLASDINRLLAPGKTAAAESGFQPGDSRIKTVLQRALALLGTPYRWGGASPEKGFDCSGLVSYVFRNAMGIELPRVSRDMAQSGELIADRTKLAEGDLVFFGRRGRVDHVGIYVGEGRFVHAPSTGKDVMVSSLDTGYWSNKYMQARRVAGI